MALIPTNRDYNKPSKDLALEQIALATKYRIPSTKIVFGKPKVLDILPSDNTDENTFITAKVVQGTIPSTNGSVSFIYRREDLTALYVVDPIVIDPPNYPFTVYEILPQINVLLGAQLSKADVVDEVHYGDNFTIKAAPGSLMWTGERAISADDMGLKFLLDTNTTFGFTAYVNA